MAVESPSRQPWVCVCQVQHKSWRSDRKNGKTSTCLHSCMKGTVTGGQTVADSWIVNFISAFFSLCLSLSLPLFRSGCLAHSQSLVITSFERWQQMISIQNQIWKTLSTQSERRRKDGRQTHDATLAMQPTPLFWTIICPLVKSQCVLMQIIHAFQPSVYFFLSFSELHNA